MTNIIDHRLQRTEDIDRSQKAEVGSEEKKTEDKAKDAETLLVSLKEKAVILDHLLVRSPTNKEVEAIKTDLERTIKELEALNV